MDSTAVIKAARGEKGHSHLKPLETSEGTKTRGGTGRRAGAEFRQVEDQVLGWEAKMSLREEIAETYTWIEDQVEKTRDGSSSHGR